MIGFGEFFNPFGVWEVVDSVQSMCHSSPQAGLWPAELLGNGNRLVITDNVFRHEGSLDSWSFVSMDYTYIDSRYWNIFNPYSLLREAATWAVDILPNPTISVGFYLDEFSHARNSPEIFVVDSDTILYNDFRYFYKLRRVDTEV